MTEETGQVSGGGYNDAREQYAYSKPESSSCWSSPREEPIQTANRPC